MSENVDELFARALAMHASGRDAEATQAYVDVLKRDATHLGALENLGTLLFNGGYRTAARTAYRQAVACHPGDAVARVNYANALLETGELAEACAEYRAAIAIDAHCDAAHQGLSYALEREGDLDGAQRHRDLGFTGNHIVHVPYRGDGRAIVALLLLSARRGNVNTERFLDDRTFFVTKVFADYYDPADPLPFHSFVFNAIGDAELCGRALDGARAILTRTNAPVINKPDAVARTGRADNARRLGALPGVTAARTLDYPRAALEAPGAARTLADDGLSFPLLVRTPGHHTGHYFVKAGNPAELRDAIAQLPGTWLTAMSFLDARGPGGLVRKYRAMIVDGSLYPLHAAVAREWKVHFFTAAMREQQAYRDEDAAFLEDMRAAIGQRAHDALQAIAVELALDYGGIDFGLDAGGNVLLFEANAAMVVPGLDNDPLFAYRVPALERIYGAIRAMLLERAAQ